MRFGYPILWLVLAGCGKQVNPEFCDAHPADDRCLGAVPDVSNPSDGLAGACPADYDQAISGSTSKYRIVDAAALWSDAESDCLDDGATGSRHTHLVVLSNEVERQGLSAHIDRERHIGHSDAITEGRWLAITTEAGVYPEIEARTVPPWGATEPSGSGNCSVIAPGLDLRDRDCTTDAHAYICECDGYAEDPTRF